LLRYVGFRRRRLGGSERWRRKERVSGKSRIGRRKGKTHCDQLVHISHARDIIVNFAVRPQMRLSLQLLPSPGPVLRSESIVDLSTGTGVSGGA
jgi:hypothetical protein